MAQFLITKERSYNLLNRYKKSDRIIELSPATYFQADNAILKRL